MEIIRLSQIQVSEKKRIHEALQRGAAIAYPTDTLYGVGVDIHQPAGVEKLLAIKGSERDKPVSVLYPNIARVIQDFPNINPYQRRIVNTLLPGPITLILPVDSDSRFPEPFVRNGYVGVRVVDLPPLNRLLAEYPHPISTTSINPAGLPPARSVPEILAYFPTEFDLIVDNGSLNGQASTAIKILHESYQLLRLGSMSEQIIEKRLNR